MATFKFSDPELDDLCDPKAKEHITKQKDVEHRIRLKKKHKKLLQLEREKKLLSNFKGRTRSEKATEMTAFKAEQKISRDAQMAVSTVVNGMVGDTKPGLYEADVEYEATLAELTTDVGREVHNNGSKQNGYDCMPIALATSCATNPFSGMAPAQIRFMGSEAISKMVADKVYSRGSLVKDIMTEHSLMSWEQIITHTLGDTWLGKLHVDALARAHNVELMTAQKTGKRTFAVLKFGPKYPNFGKKVASAQEIAEHTGCILLNQNGSHWVALAPVCARPAATRPAADVTVVATKKRKRII